MEKNQSSSSSSWMSFSSQCQNIEFNSFQRSFDGSKNRTRTLSMGFWHLCAPYVRADDDTIWTAPHLPHIVSKWKCYVAFVRSPENAENTMRKLDANERYCSRVAQKAMRAECRHVTNEPHTHTNTNADISSIHSQSHSRARNIWTESDGCWSIAVESWRCRYRCAETNSGQFTRMFSRDKLFPAIGSHTHIKCDSTESVRPVIAFWRSQLKCWKIPFVNIFFAAVLSEFINETEHKCEHENKFVIKIMMISLATPSKNE